MEVHLRKAGAADRERINELFCEMLRSIYRTDDVKGYGDGELDRYFDGGEDWVCLAESGGTVVAFLSIEVHREETDYLYLDDLSVTERFRNAGIGTALLRRAEAYAGELGIRAIVFHVLKTNRAAFRLYTRLGYGILRDDGDRFLMGGTPERGPLGAERREREG